MLKDELMKMDDLRPLKNNIKIVRQFQKGFCARLCTGEFHRIQCTAMIRVCSELSKKGKKS